MMSFSTGPLGHLISLRCREDELEMTPTENLADQDILVVSGLPRSGTSLMMRMLAAAGLDLLVDGLRQADEANPHGYYEFEPAKSLREGNTEWLQNARGRVVKIVSPLLPYLPASFTYRIIFMHRNLNEVMASQAKMLNGNQIPTNLVQDRQIQMAFQTHLSRVETWLANQTNMTVLNVSYNQLLLDPPAVISGLVSFITRPLNTQAMLAAIDPTLYRNRLEPTSPA